jgi:hypothetical protein
MIRPRCNRPPRHAQTRGFVLIALLVLLTMGGLYFFVGQLTPSVVEALRQKQTATALAEAREALIGYALSYRDEQIKNGNLERMYGYLPMPDLGKSRATTTDVKCRDAGGRILEGCEAYSASGISDVAGIKPTIVGRLPWRTLGIPPLRDGYEECLWLIVSSLHLAENASNSNTLPMNWDTLGQIDIVVANGGSTLASTLATAHERPVAIIYAPGPRLDSQDRHRSTTDYVDECGGNYEAKNYLDPFTNSALNGVTNYLEGTNSANDTKDNTYRLNTPKQMLTRGSVFSYEGNFHAGDCKGQNCISNDIGLPVTGDSLFSAIRRNANFRTDINSMLDRMTSCLRDQVANGSLTRDANSTGLPASPLGKLTGRIPANDTCYGDAIDPQGYYRNYKELIFFAKPTTGTDSFSANGQNCSAVLLFANQRTSTQRRVTSGTGGEKNTPGNYLEGENLSSFIGSNISCPTNITCLFSGPEQFDRISTAQAASQDIVRCIPAGASLNQVASPVLASLGLPQLTNYDAATRTLTLGAIGVSTAQVGTANAQSLFGCSWTPESHGMGSGFRSYFKFNIADTGEGFTFAIIDGDRNSSNVCGAAQQHLGYSGNNTFTSSIAYPKIGIEVDTTETTAQKMAFDPTLSNTLTNGRSDPNYTGGHVAVVYWGGETNIATGSNAPCNSPRIDVAGACYLPQEEDDNVHGLPTSPDASLRPAPRNPAAPATPIAPPTGVYKLDPNLSSVPANKDIHIRIEISKVALPSLTSVRVAAQSNVNLSNPGASLDGIAMNNGDRVLLTAQSNPAENGIYAWNSAASTMTRTTDANTATALQEATTQVTAGAQAGTSWRQTETIATLGIDPINWAQNVTRYLVESWVLADSATVANQIAAMQNTTRPMSQLYSTFTPQLRDSPLIFDIQGSACPCSTNQVCGSDNMCYTKAFQNVRLGFTNSQSTAAKDQLINITNFSTTWLP